MKFTVVNDCYITIQKDDGKAPTTNDVDSAFLQLEQVINEKLNCRIDGGFAAVRIHFKGIKEGEKNG